MSHENQEVAEVRSWQQDAFSWLQGIDGKNEAYVREDMLLQKLNALSHQSLRELNQIALSNRVRKMAMDLLKSQLNFRRKKKRPAGKRQEKKESKRSHQNQEAKTTRTFIDLNTTVFDVTSKLMKRHNIRSDDIMDFLLEKAKEKFQQCVQSGDSLQMALRKMSSFIGEYLTHKAISRKRIYAPAERRPPKVFVGNRAANKGRVRFIS